MAQFRSPAFLVAFVVSILATSLASASPLIGTSWDGNPPGTLADIAGCDDFSFGLPKFAAGQYQITWGGSFTIWRDLTTIGYDDGVQTTVFNPGWIIPTTTRTISADAPWTLWADTPSVTDAQSTGPQWAFDQISDNEWIWGLEDIQLGLADGDWNDAFGTLQFIAPLTPPVTVDDTPTTTDLPSVPEPSTYVLILTGVGLLWLRSRRAL